MKTIVISMFLLIATFLGCKPENAPQKVRIEHLGHSIDTNLLLILQQQTDTAQYIILQKLTQKELDEFFKTYNPTGTGCVFYKDAQGRIVGTKVIKK